MSNWWESNNDSGGDWKKDDSAWNKEESSSWNNTGSWGNDAGGQEQNGNSWDSGNKDWGSAQASQPPPAREFWENQAWNAQSGTLSRKEDWELARDDELLFDSKGRAKAGLSFSRYEQVPVDVSGQKVNAIPVCKTFEAMFSNFQSFMPDALRYNLSRCGYETPTPVQKFAIPCGLVGRDIMCCAQTGSGKTAAFLIPAIGSMMKNHAQPCGSLQVPFSGPVKPDVLVLTPTRELCLQIFQEAQKMCHRTPYRPARVYGGEKPKEQMVDIAKGADLLVATPGRLTDFVGRGIIEMKHVNVLVLDEADRMLDMGFESQIREIIRDNEMPPKDERQTMMFSATFPDKCQQLAQDFLYEYAWIAVGVLGGAVETVEQSLIKVQPTEKFEKLMETLDNFYASRTTDDRMLIFVNAKDTAKWLDEQLYEKKFDSGALHGNLEQHERETNLMRFRKGEIDIMIATDVAARGLDIENVAIVVNYDMAQDTDTYIHRIGRTGRIGNEGRAITFLSCGDDGASLEQVGVLKELVNILQASGQKLPEWFEGLIETTEGNSGWSWGGKDYRSDKQEEYKASGSGDAWSNWGKSDNDGGGGDWNSNSNSGW